MGYDLALLRRKETVGVIAAVATGLGFLWVYGNPYNQLDGWGIFAIVMGWVFAAYWVALDARYRGAPVFPWTAFTLAAAPVALLFYFVSRPPAPSICTLCGSQVSVEAQVCPTCGKHLSPVNRLFSSFTESLTPGPLEKARQTAKFMAIALGAFVLFGMMFGRMLRIPEILGVLAISAYWILVAWWVYLDAMWRRMEAVPWALLTLLTNLIGVVTYLVIRYPDPRICQRCGASVPRELKLCPYCGSQSEPTCPRCQSPVKPGWVYCPSCATQLPQTGIEPVQTSPASISIGGTVLDGVTGEPIPGAEIRIDSKADDRSATTDPLGRFLLADLEPHPYVLLASAQGYRTQAKAYSPGAGASPQVNFTLCRV